MRCSVTGLIFALLLATASPAKAVIFLLLQDPHDDGRVIRAAHDKKEVIESRKKLEEFTKKFHPLKERHILDIFGKPQQKPEKGYAMPVAQSRCLGLCGLRYGDIDMNKDHTDFHVVNDFAAVEVYYHIDGESPAAILVYLRLGDDFPKLTADNLAERLAWEEVRMKKLVAFFESRTADLFPYEIDRKELAKLHEGDFAVDAKAKLEAWIKSGEKLGYAYEHEDGSNRWFWYRPDGTLAREAFRGAKDGPPVSFKWYHHDGSSELRQETFSYPEGRLASRRWCQPGTTNCIRFEGRGSWAWYGTGENKVIRQEWDDNGDGIPDWYIDKDDLPLHIADDKAKEKRKPLKLKDSWTVNPKLIPEESRISDQPELRLPVRLKAS